MVKKSGKKSLSPALREWLDKIKKYREQHGCTQKQAMMALSKKRKARKH
jgi:hypothetical protein